MPLSKLVSLEKELGAQYRSIGFPMESELSQSDNVVYVHSYTRDNGTIVKSHWRSKPNTGSITGGASEIKETPIEEPESHENNIYINQEKLKELGEEKYKALYPDEIAGVKRGKERTFLEMVKLNQNPKLNSEEDDGVKYTKNCQSCTIASELNCRGYDVEAVSWGNDILKEISGIDRSAYIDSNTGKVCIPQKINIEKNNCFDYLKKNLIPNARYEFGYYLTADAPDAGYEDTDGHVVIMTKGINNNIIIYDPQIGQIYENAELYFNSVVNQYNTIFAPRILRVDDKILNPKYIRGVVQKKKEI